MLANLFLAALGATSVAGHAILQKISVNGQDQGQLKGIRAPNWDGPLQNVNDPAFACNKDIQHKDNNVITIPAGARVGGWWGHVIGGASGPGDKDNPIAPGHKGPMMYYLAKVDNAASAGTTGLKWFKVAHEGLSNGKWGVDSMISGGGWHYFTMPSCVAPGDYLLRVELLALHGAFTQGEAQFYMECAQIRVTGNGNNNGADFVSFPGAYSATHPGVLVSIYDNSGNPNNGGRSYSIPGPNPLSCSGGSGGGGAAPVTTTPNNGGGGGGGGGAPLWGQCGGEGWTGPKSCSSGWCKVSHRWYSQCVQ